MSGPLRPESASFGDAASAQQPAPIRSLCAKYHYPHEVADVLSAILDILRPANPLAVLLLGSASRGEFTWWRGDDGRVRFASDLEMYVVAREPVDADLRGALNRAASDLAAGYNGTGEELFHIDLAFTTPGGLARHAHTFRCWDTRQTGWTLLGDDATALLPDFPPENLDFRQLNEVPMHRLWEMVLRLPGGLLGGSAAESERRAYSYVVARQALDLTTWLLPHCGVFIPTFRRRVAAWEEGSTELGLARYFDRDYGRFLEECLRTKTDFVTQRPISSLHERTLEGFHAGLRTILRSPPDERPDATVARVLAQGREHWHVESGKRRLYELYMLARDRRLPVMPRHLRWLTAQKKPLQIGFLLYMNYAIGAMLTQREADPFLAGAEAMLGRLWYDFRPVTGEPLGRLLGMRRGYVDYLVRSSRWFGPRRDYLYSVIGE